MSPSPGVCVSDPITTFPEVRNRLSCHRVRTYRSHPLQQILNPISEHLLCMDLERSRRSVLGRLWFEHKNQVNCDLELYMAYRLTFGTVRDQRQELASPAVLGDGGRPARAFQIPSLGKLCCSGDIALSLVPGVVVWSLVASGCQPYYNFIIIWSR